MKGKIFLSRFLALCCALLTGLISSSSAVLFFSFAILVIGYIYSRSVQKDNREQAILLFNLVFSLLAIFAILHYMDTVVDYKEFAQSWRDEYKFWLRSKDVADHHSFSGVFNRAFSPVYFKNGGYYLYIGTLGYIADTFFDGNNLLLQFMGSVLWGSLLPIGLYKIFIIYFEKKQAFIKVLYFSLFSVLFAYSFQFLRDISITFFYVVAFYQILREFKIYRLLLLVFLMFIVWWLRFESGLFLLIFIAFYIYKRFKKNKAILVLSSVIFLPIIVIIFDQYFSQAFLRIDSLGERSQQSNLNDPDAMSRYLYLLPSPIRELASLLYSQIKPFPSWISLKNATNIYQVIIGLLPIIYSVFWYVIVFSIIKWHLFEHFYKKLQKELNILMLICLIFMVSNVIGELNLRRLMPVYPFFILTYHLTKDEVKKRNLKYNRISKIKETNIQAISFYILLVVIYLMMKI